MNLIAKRRIWYTISLLIIVPGLISLFTHGLLLGIDFKGGQQLEVQGQVQQSAIQSLANQLKLQDVSTVSSGSNTMIRYTDASSPKTQQADHQTLSSYLAKQGHQELSFDTVGPSISASITRNAIIAVALAATAIILYIAFAFRNIPPPMNSWNFGVAAVIAMLHDALLLIGVFSLLGVFFKVEIDSLFVTAVLTVIGFSVHDTIVVFDRIRENLRKERGDFPDIVNSSILETLARSLNTSFTVLLTLLALYLFGGESIKLFVLALLIGIASGTYSSIFNASPILVTWYNYRQKRAARPKS
ncbi:MAG TPA: protein translocase subunit SecF [Candidatus Saccharimonadales bacterium]|jgi:preprotein translocase subunit SecF|nr:protein translocase subunit SecF [Candidatus Saccharimonadales bacterium]